MGAESYDVKLAAECAKAFHTVCGVGCAVTDIANETKCTYGYATSACRLCALAGQDSDTCHQAQIYGMTEAERFGGKYIFLCPMGLACFVSPIIGSGGVEAKITVGPFLLVDKQDYIACDLGERKDLTASALVAIMEELEHIPYIPAEKVTEMSTLLYMSAGFMNNVYEANRLLETKASVEAQYEISSYIHQLKQETAPPYPIETENALLSALRHVDRPEAQRLLNELLGYFLFSTGDLSRMKARIYELLVLINRTAISCGSDPDVLLENNRRYFFELGAIADLDALYTWLKHVMRNVMDSIFSFEAVRHSNIIHRSIQYINAHYAEHITLEDIAREVYLSPSYFSRIFKQDMGESMTTYLNRIRIERSKKLLQDKGLRLTDVAQAVGFEDHSYFTKVFKKITGMTPITYRERLHKPQ